MVKVIANKGLHGIAASNAAPRETCRSAYKKMIPANIKTFPGFKEVEDLLPDGHLVNYKQIWSVKYDHFLDESGDLCNRLIWKWGWKWGRQGNYLNKWYMFYENTSFMGQYRLFGH